MTIGLKQKCILLNLKSQEYTLTYLENHQFTKYDLLIIGSFGEVSASQTVQVAHKLIPSDQEGSNQWMTKEIDNIMKLHEKSPHCDHIFPCFDLPGTEISKDYYLEEIRSFFTKCTQNSGKRDTYILYRLYMLII